VYKVAPDSEPDRLKEAGEEVGYPGKVGETVRAEGAGPREQRQQHEDHAQPGEELAGVPPILQALLERPVVLEEPLAPGEGVCDVVDVEGLRADAPEAGGDAAPHQGPVGGDEGEGAGEEREKGEGEAHGPGTCTATIAHRGENWSEMLSKIQYRMNPRIEGDVF